MSATIPTGQGEPGGGLPVPPISDEESGARAIESLLDFGDDDSGDDLGADAGEQNSGQEPDAGPDESQTPGDDEPGTTEPPELAPATLEAPSSWTAEEKTLFSSLPPAAQEAITRRDSEQRALVTKATQEVANERKGWDAERQAIASARQEYISSLNQLTQLALPEAQALANVNWAKLSAENPAEYVRLSGLRDQLRDRIGAVQQELQRVQAQQQQAQQQQLSRLKAEQQQLLVAKVPDFGDAEKGPKLAANLRKSVADGYGFTEAEVNDTLDHRLLAMAVDAMRWRNHQAAQKTAPAKKANTAPTLQRPGVQPAANSAERVFQQDVNRLRQTGRERDAARVLEHFIS